MWGRNDFVGMKSVTKVIAQSMKDLVDEEEEENIECKPLFSLILLSLHIYFRTITPFGRRNVPTNPAVVEK